MNGQTPKCQTASDRLPTLTLLITLAVIFIVRCCIAASHLDMGCDIATYLATTNAFFGHDPTGFGLDRPPLIALPLKVFTLVFGDLNGVKLLGILLSVAIAIPFYLFARRICHRWVAIGMTLVFVLTPAYSDMLTWGYITMFGMLFGLLTLYFFLQVLDRPSKANVILAGLFGSFVVGFHQLSLAFFAPLFFLLATAFFIFNRQAILKNFKPALAATAIGLILSIPYVPLYLRMLSMQTASSPETSISLVHLSMPWIMAIVLSLPIAALALRCIWQQEKNIAIAVAMLLLYSLVLILFVLPPPFAELNRRAHYFIYPAIWLLTGVVLSRIWSEETAPTSTLRSWLPKAGVVTLAIVLLSSTTFLSFVTLHRGLEFYGYLDDTRWDAVRWIKDNAPHNASIAAYPEALGWWIEGEAKRNTATVTDRETVPYVFLRERSLTAERVLSRNQGLENGDLRLATTYPYGGASGQPVLGVYVGGSYHDIMMFDDRATSVAMEGGKADTLNSASSKEFSVSGDGDSMCMTTRYRIDGATVVQTATLNRGSQTATVSYRVESDSSSAARFDVSVLFGYAPKSASTAADQSQIETIQFLRSKTDQVVTQINIAGDGAAIQKVTTDDSRMDLSFNIQSAVATVSFSFDVSEPDLESKADVVHYDVSQIVKAPGLRHLASIDYLAIDLNPNPHLASAPAWGTEEWLNACPYFKLVYAQGDIRIYKVDPTALP